MLHSLNNTQASYLSSHRKLVCCWRGRSVSAAVSQRAGSARQGERWKRSFPQEGELVFLCGFKTADSYLAFTLPKSRLHLVVPQGQSPGPSQMLLHSCLPLPHRMSACFLTVSIHHLQVLPHSRVSGYTFLPSRSSVFLMSFSLTMATVIPLSLILLSSFFTDLINTLDLHWEELRSLQCWKILSTYFLIVIGSAGDANQRLQSLLSNWQASKSGSFCPRMTIIFLPCSGNDWMVCCTLLQANINKQTWAWRFHVEIWLTKVRAHCWIQQLCYCFKHWCVKLTASNH